MARQAPWSVKGVDDEARQVARDAAAAAGLPIGAWVDRAILKAAGDPGTTGSRHEKASALPAASLATGPEPESSSADGAGTAQGPRLGGLTADAVYAQGAALRPAGDLSADSAIGHGKRLSRAPRRGIVRPIGGMLAIVVVLGVGLWLMNRPGGPPAPAEAVQATGAQTPPADPGGEQTAAVVPEQAEPALQAPSGSRAGGAEGPLERLTAAAQAGNAKAQYELGLLYSRGEAVPRDDKAAAGWLERAALGGLASAQHELGLMYEQGRGVPASPQLAFFWYKSAANQDHPGAQYELGMLYAEGKGTPQDYRKAAELFAKAAAAGVAAGDYSLGSLHEHGLGVAADMARAREHYRKAAEAGSSKAADRLKLIASLPEGATPRPAPEAARLIGPTVPARETPAPAPSEPLGPKGIAEVQRLLLQLSFQPGPADGIAGERTVDAIRLYQQFAGLAIDGKPTEALLQDLRQVVSAMKGNTEPPAGSDQR